jgi:hypothetical protein
VLTPLVSSMLGLVEWWDARQWAAGPSRPALGPAAALRGVVLAGWQRGVDRRVVTSVDQDAPPSLPSSADRAAQVCRSRAVIRGFWVRTLQRGRAHGPCHGAVAWSDDGSAGRGSIFHAYLPS